MKSLSTIAFILLIAACSRATEQLEVSEQWVRLNPPGSFMTAGYGSLRNEGSEPLTLDAMSSPHFGDISLHQTVEIDGKARMRSVDNLTLAPGEHLTMSPGGYHLMLMQATSDLKQDQSIAITFEFAGGYQTTVPFIVRKP